VFLQVNPNFAVDLIAEDPVVICTQRVVFSNSGGALGHPKVYINLVRVVMPVMQGPSV
jgi:NADH dehydrogenase (ubiquinone) Fe-S protein 6